MSAWVYCLVTAVVILAFANKAQKANEAARAKAWDRLVNNTNLEVAKLECLEQRAKVEAAYNRIQGDFHCELMARRNILIALNLLLFNQKGYEELKESFSGEIGGVSFGMAKVFANVDFYFLEDAEKEYKAAVIKYLGMEGCKSERYYLSTHYTQQALTENMKNAIKILNENYKNHA
jgi:hypothetical protein